MTADWSIEDKTTIVTGANTGLGRATAVELARRGSRVILAARSEQRTEPVLQQISTEVGSDRVGFLQLDLASLASTKRAADTVLAGDRSLHVLINNAGLAGRTGLTTDGFELTFGVNYLGHYLFTRLLLDRLIGLAPARIVHVTSSVHYRADGIEWSRLRRRPLLAARSEYATSKLANILFNRSLADRLAGTGVTSYAAHPGLASSDIYRVVPRPLRGLMLRRMPTVEQAARTQVWCASEPELSEESWLYYANLERREPSAVAADDALADELWARSDAWVADYL